MVNYDLPWNPNRLEQRFGRIHRIGQAEVCHLWNLVAAETREGEVYGRLLEKLERARAALGGRDAVYDVLGELFQGRPLRELLMEAVLYGDDPRHQQRLFIDGAGARSSLTSPFGSCAIGSLSSYTSRSCASRRCWRARSARRSLDRTLIMLSPTTSTKRRMNMSD
jgi:hypothetical protein